MNQRRNTRSQVWPDTKATINVVEDYGGGSRGRIKITGNVQNIGANGLFVKTDEIVPVPAKAEIVINFDSTSGSSRLSIRATGETVHASSEGIGLRFTTIDLNKLQRCIIAKMNKLDEKAKYKLKSG